METVPEHFKGEKLILWNETYLQSKDNVIALIDLLYLWKVHFHKDDLKTLIISISLYGSRKMLSFCNSVFFFNQYIFHLNKKTEFRLLYENYLNPSRPNSKKLT